MKAYPPEINDMVESVRAFTKSAPRVAVILGSGLSGLKSEFPGTRVRFDDIPGLSPTSVKGHSGELVISESVCLCAGRYHLYEGHPVSLIRKLVVLLHALGTKTLIVTNAAGGINTSYKPGDIIAVRDHINMTGENPLIGISNSFVDMHNAYDPELRRIASSHIPGYTEGVYAAMKGPSYETPAEVDMLSRLGADLVGMSTVPEVIAARHAGMKVLAFSLVGNHAAGIDARGLSHDDVLASAGAAGEKLGTYLQKIIPEV